MAAKKANPGTYAKTAAKDGASALLIVAVVIGVLIFAGPGLIRGGLDAAGNAAADGASDLANGSGQLATKLAPLTAFGDGPYGPNGRYPGPAEPAAGEPTAPAAKPTTAWTTPEPSPSPPAGDGVKARIRAIEPGEKDYPGPPESAKPEPETGGDWPRLGEAPSGGLLGAVPLVGPIVKELVAGGAVKALNP